MTTNVIHLMSAITTPGPTQVENAWFYARRLSTVAIANTTIVDIDMDDVIEDDDSLLDGSGVFIVPAKYNGFYAQLTVGGLLVDDRRAIVGFRRSTDGGTVFNPYGRDFAESNCLNATRLMKLVTGHQYVPYVYSDSGATTLSVDTRTFFEGYIYRDL